MNPQLRRRIFIYSVGAVVILSLVYGFLPKPVPVDTAPAARGPFRVVIEEEGRTRVKDRFVVSAPVPGYLRRISLDVGDAVSPGQQIAGLEPLRSTVLDPRSRAEAEAAVAAAQAQLDAAREKARAAAADAEYARERELRALKLSDSGYIAKDSLDQAVSEAKKAGAMRHSADAAVIAARADLDRAQSVLGHSAADPASGTSRSIVSVRAPVAGTVLKLHRESEGVVNAGDPLLDIGNPESLEVRSEVLSDDAVKLKKGMPVLIERWGGDRTIEGVVRVVEPSGFTKVSSLGVEEQRVNVIVDLVSPREVWQKLGDGYRLDVQFIVWEGMNVLQVPSSALFRKGSGWALFTVVKKRATLQEVGVGRRNGLSAEITHGLSEGTVVITNPEDTVKDGIRVRARDR